MDVFGIVLITVFFGLALTLVPSAILRFSSGIEKKWITDFLYDIYEFGIFLVLLTIFFWAIYSGVSCIFTPENNLFMLIVQIISGILLVSSICVIIFAKDIGEDKFSLFALLFWCNLGLTVFGIAYWLMKFRASL